MNAKEITVGYTYTKNLGNYENVKVDASVTISVEPGQEWSCQIRKGWILMDRYEVTQVKEIRSTFVVRAPNAHLAIQRARKYDRVEIPSCSEETHYTAREIKEVNNND